MIVLDIYEDELGTIKQFVVQGHAGYKPHGEDIVCAGISILAQTAVLGLIKYLTSAPQVEKKAGYLKCSLPRELGAKEQELAQVILQTMLLGLEATQQRYGKYMEIHKRRWTECL